MYIYLYISYHQYICTGICEVFSQLLDVRFYFTRSRWVGLLFRILFVNGLQGHTATCFTSKWPRRPYYIFVSCLYIHTLLNIVNIYIDGLCFCINIRYDIAYSTSVCLHFILYVSLHLMYLTAFARGLAWRRRRVLPGDASLTSSPGL